MNLRFFQVYYMEKAEKSSIEILGLLKENELSTNSNEIGLSTRHQNALYVLIQNPIIF